MLKLQETLQSTCMIQDAKEFDGKTQIHALPFLQLVDCTLAGDIKRDVWEDSLILSHSLQGQ